jgi:hypothetical protein
VPYLFVENQEQEKAVGLRKKPPHQRHGFFAGIHGLTVLYVKVVKFSINK